MIQHHLLLVDGDTTALEAQTRFLRSQGFIVTSTSNADDALAVLSTGPLPVVAVIATFLPGTLDGFGLCAALKSKPAVSNIRCIFLCDRLLGEHSEGRQTQIRQALKDLEISLEDYLPRSVSGATLVERIMHHITTSGRSQLESALLAGVTNVGRLEFMGPEEIALFFERNNLSGKVLLHVPGDDHPQMFFRSGQLIDARFGKFTEDKAFFSILTIAEGSFEVIFGEPGRPAIITTPTQSLILEGQKQASEIRWIKSQLPPINTVMNFNIEVLSERLGNIPDEENRLLKLFDGKTSLQTVLNKTDFDELTALRTIQNYFFDGLLVDSRTMTPPPLNRFNTDRPLASPIPAPFTEEITPSPLESSAPIDSMLRAMADTSGAQLEQTAAEDGVSGTSELTRSTECPDCADAEVKSSSKASPSEFSEKEDPSENQPDEFFSEGTPFIGDEIASQKEPQKDSSSSEEPLKNACKEAPTSWMGSDNGLESVAHLESRTTPRHSLRPTLAADQEILGNDAETPVPSRQILGAQPDQKASAKGTMDEVKPEEKSAPQEKIEAPSVGLDVVFFDDPAAFQGVILASDEPVQEPAKVRFHESFEPPAGVATGGAASDQHVIDILNGLCDDDEDDEESSEDEEDDDCDEDLAEKLKELSKIFDSTAREMGSELNESSAQPTNEDAVDSEGAEKMENGALEENSESEEDDADEEDFFASNPVSTSKAPATATEPESEVEEPSPSEDGAEEDDDDEDDFFSQPPIMAATTQKTSEEKAHVQQENMRIDEEWGKTHADDTPTEKSASSPEDKSLEDVEATETKPVPKSSSEKESSNTLRVTEQARGEAFGGFSLADEEDRRKTEVDSTNAERFARRRRIRFLAFISLGVLTGAMAAMAAFFLRPKEVVELLSQGKEVLSQAPVSEMKLPESPQKKVSSASQPVPPVVPESPSIAPQNAPTHALETKDAEIAQKHEETAKEEPRAVSVNGEKPRPDATTTDKLVASQTDVPKEAQRVVEERVPQRAEVAAGRPEKKIQDVEAPPTKQNVIVEPPPHPALKASSTLEDEELKSAPKVPVPPLAKPMSTKLDDEGAGLPLVPKTKLSRLDDDGEALMPASPKATPAKLDDDEELSGNASKGESKEAREEAAWQETLMRGAKFLDSEDYPKAARVFEEALKKRPNDQKAMSGLGRAVVETNPRRAIKLLNQAVALDPSDKLAWYDLGVANQFVEPERTQDAIRAYEKFLSLAPKSKNPSAAETRSLVQSMKEDLKQRTKLDD